MKIKPFAAFGHVLIRNSCVKGEVYSAVVEEGTPCTIFWAKGHYKNKNLTTGEDFRDLPRGTFLRPEDLVPGVFEHTAVEESDVFCYDARLNGNQSIGLIPWHLPGGTETVLPVGTKLFLCSGTLTVHSNNIEKPTQLHVRFGDSLVTAVHDCYGLIFP
jgi:hypothetical protein